MSNERIAQYLPDGLPSPVAEPDGLSLQFWNGLRGSRLMIQRCAHCATWIFAPEWICHSCHSFDLEWQEVEPRGRIFSWERVWRASHPALSTATPYLAVLVELASADNVRMLGNLHGDPLQNVQIGACVSGIFEHHEHANPPYSLLQWQLTRQPAR